MSHRTDNPQSHEIREHLHAWKQSAHSHFDRWAHHYDRDLINLVLFDPTHRRVLSELRQWRRRGLCPMRMLDVGCGTGTLLLRAAARPGCISQGQGLDMSPNMVSYAQEKAGMAGMSEKVRFTVGDSEHLPFEDGSFDLVTCCNSFHHYPHQERAVAEMWRVLAPGGHVIIVDGSRDDPFGWFVFDVAVERAEKDVHHCSSAEFLGLLQGAGFGEIRQQVFHIVPPTLINRARKAQAKEVKKEKETGHGSTERDRDGIAVYAEV